MASRSLVLRAASSLAAILILAAGCSDLGPTATQLEPTTVSAAKGAKANVLRAGQHYAAGTYAAVIGPQGGTLSFGTGTLSFPAGAVSRPTRITAKVTGQDVAAEFGPHGLQFPADAQPTLTFSYAGTGADANSLQVLYLSNDGTVLAKLATMADIASETIKARVPHFSVYAAGIGN